MRKLALYDQPLQYRWLRPTIGDPNQSILFDTPNGQEIRAWFDFDQSAYTVYVMFGALDSDGRAQMDISGKGEALTIFATIADALRTYLETTGAVRISFSGKNGEGGRNKLYQALATRMGKLLGGRVEVFNTGKDTNFWVTLHRPLG